MSRANVREGWIEGGVPGEKNCVIGASNNPAAPEGSVSIEQTPSREVLRRNANQLDSAKYIVLVPCHLFDIRPAERAYECADAQWNPPCRRGKSRSELANGFRIEVIVVIVGNQDCVDERKRVESHPGRGATLGSGEGTRGRAIAPYGIGENVQAANLEKDGGVTDPRCGERTGSCARNLESGDGCPRRLPFIRSGSVRSPLQRPSQEIPEAMARDFGPGILKAVALPFREVVTHVGDSISMNSSEIRDASGAAARATRNTRGASPTG